jgi:hypothetical protein
MVRATDATGAWVEQQPPGVLDLLRRQRRWAAETLPRGAGDGPALAGALGPAVSDQARQGAEDREDEVPVTRAGVETIAEGVQPDLALLEAGDEPDQLVQGAPQSLQARHEEGAAGTQCGEAGGQLPTVGAAARDRVGEHGGAAGLG